MRQIPFEREKIISVTYKDIIVGKHKLDFLVEDKVVVELKVVQTILDIHVSQVISLRRSRGLLLAYLAASQKKVGLILNFAEQRLVDGVKRIVL